MFKHYFGVGKKKKWRWMKEWFKKRHVFSHENLKDLEVSEPEDYNIFAHGC
jgi:hypothetical protein